jgi:hypothetical protein
MVLHQGPRPFIITKYWRLMYHKYRNEVQEILE